MAEVLVGGVRVFDAAPSLQGSAAIPVATDAVELVRVGAFIGTGPTPATRAEVADFDPASDNLFITNAAQHRIDIAHLDAHGAATAAGGIELGGLTGYGGVNSVAVKNGVVAVAYGNAVGGQPGYVALFDASTGVLQKLIQVGVLPDQVTFSPDGKKLLVANEAEPTPADVANGIAATNAAGSVSVIDLSGGAAAATVSNTISFAALGGSEAALKAQGLALFPGLSAAVDIEPEYVAVSADGKRAYVTLQEVNAVAVIDLTDPTATKPISIQPLGGVDHGLAGNQFDPSDTGNVVQLGNFDVIGLLQPDAIATFTVAGVTYFATANEGDARVVLDDESQVSDADYTMDLGAYPTRDALEANPQLGKLKVLNTVGDTEGDGDFDQVYTYGGRGLSIFRQNADGTITKVRETGGEFERIIADKFTSLHNSENLAGRDSRSDNKGPEPEGVAIGAVGGRLYAFVTLERVGGVMVYDVTDPANASFVSYRPATAGDFAPETVKFVSAADSPTGQALLISANEVSGTTTIYAVANDKIAGAAASETLYGRSGADSIVGAAGDDTVIAGGGNDSVLGGAGADSLAGGEGDDSIDGGAAPDVIDGGAGGDTLIGNSADDQLAGGADNDSLTGDAGADTLSGDGGNDTLAGGSGADTLTGGAGDDSLVGGSGGDLFRFAPGSGNDVIADFKPGSDVLDFSGQTAPIYASVGGDALISFADGSSVRLMGVTLGEYLGS